MNRKPIGRHESFFGGGLMEVIIRQTFVFAIVSLIAYYLGCIWGTGSLDWDNENAVAVGRTMAFLVTGWTSILHVLTVRSRKMLYKYRFKENPQLYISCAAMLVVFTLLAATPVASFLDMTSLNVGQWFTVIGLSLVPTLFAEYGKLWDAIRSRNAEKTKV